MKNFLIVLLLLCFTSCKENKDSQKKTADVSSQQPNVDVDGLVMDHMKWWTYHYNTISLSSAFIAFNDKSEVINKHDFLEFLTTGTYIPVKLVTLDSLESYKLFKLESTADKGIRTTIKNVSATEFKHFKMEGTTFPGFNFVDLNGNEYTNDNTKGKIIILKCWFINCAPCVAEFPELNQLAEEHENIEDILFISLASDSKADLDTFLSKKVFNYETIPNQQEFMKKMLAVKQYPTHFVINKNGIIEKVVNKSSELISYLEKGPILHFNENKNPPPPPPSN